MRWVGLVRNVMLGRDGLDREGLLAAVASAGGVEPRSYLTTGNVTFDAAPDALDRLTQRLEAALEEILGRPTMVAMRSHDRLCGLVDSDLFAGWDETAWELEVSFLPHTAAPVERAQLRDPGRTHIVAVTGHELATARPPTGTGRPHANVLLQAASGLPATARGWGTLVRLAERG